MPLPKIEHPLYEMELPSTKKKVYYRQMLVRDEKILLMAKASEDEQDIYRAIKQVVNNCLVEVNIDTLATFDIEYAFVKLRSASIGNEVELSFKDLQDESEYSFLIDLDSVDMFYPEGVTNVVKVNDDVSLTLKYPPASLFDDAEAMKEGDKAYEWIASRCIAQIYDKDEIYTADDCTDEELLEYIMNLNTKAYNQVKKFIANMPRLHYEIKYTNKVGTERNISLKTLTDFFTLR